MRLDKFLAECNQGTRSEVKVLLKSKRVTVNGVTENSGKRQINEFSDVVCLDEKKLTYQSFVYYMLNKPKDVITATEDSVQRTVLDLIDKKDRIKGLFPVGRLDKDTTGLVLLTNDGALAHNLLAPKKHVEKVYEATAEHLLRMWAYLGIFVVIETIIAYFFIRSIKIREENKGIRNF